MAEDIYKIFNVLLTSFIGAGGLGFINFIILEKLEIIRQDKEQKDEKLLFVLFFSIVNYALFLLIFSFPDGNMFISEFIKQLSLGIILTLAISIVLSFTVYPLLAKILKLAINFFRKVILNKPSADNQTPKERLLSKGDVSTFVYIFDFDKNRIAEGYLDGWLNDTEKTNQVSVTAPGELNRYTYEQVEVMFNDLDNDPEPNTTRHLIDLDNRLHYFVFYQSNLS
jgi:hypothetical protein